MTNVHFVCLHEECEDIYIYIPCTVDNYDLLWLLYIQILESIIINNKLSSVYKRNATEKYSRLFALKLQSR